jgi:NADH:ubiquinone oxidoreductase subunit 6 (subunit J)
MLMAVLAGMIVQRDWAPFDESKSIAAASRNTIELGRLLMTDLAISVELAAVLLMVAMIGAIAVARRKLPQPDAPGEHLPPGEIGRRVKPF